MADTDEVHELCNTTKVPSKTTRSGFEVTFDPVFLEKKLRDLIANMQREAEERGAAKAVAVINNELGLELNPRGSYYITKLQPPKESE